MAGSDDKFNYPNLTLPSEFLRRLNLPPDFAQRLKALVSPEVVRKLHQFAQCSPYRTLTPQVREMIASVLKKRRDKAAIEEELRRLELWLDSEIDRKLWDPTAATSAAPREAPPAAPAELAKSVSAPIAPPAEEPPPQQPTPIVPRAAPPSPSPPQPPQELRSVEPQPVQLPPEGPPQESPSDPEEWLLPMRAEFSRIPRNRKAAWVRETAYPRMKRDLGENARWDSAESLYRAMYPGKPKKN